MSSSDSEGCGKIALVLGVIGSLIAIFVFLTGKENMPALFDKQPQQGQGASSPTQYIEQPPNPTALPNDIPLLPTDTSAPTNTPLPIPTETLPPDTPSNTILEVGQTWYQGGVTATLVSASLRNLDLHYVMVNHTPYQLTGKIEVMRNFNLIGPYAS
jgi:hypothetical protein